MVGSVCAVGTLLMVGLCAGLAVPRPAAAQSASLLLGWYLHDDDTSGEEAYPGYGLRMDHAIGRWALVELASAYVPLQLTDYSMESPRRIWDAPRYSADVHVQAQVPVGSFRPYVGLGVGLFRYPDRPAQDGARRAVVHGNSSIATLGARLDLARRMGMRAEIRLRSDSPNRSYFNAHGESWIGAYVRW